MSPGRILFAIAAVVLAFDVFFIVAKPGFIGGSVDRWDGVIEALALLGLALGVLWMIRINSANPEPDQRLWRYRNAQAVPVDRLIRSRHEPRRMPDGRRGRRIARGLLLIAGFAILVVQPFVFIAMPGVFGSVSGGPSDGIWRYAGLAVAVLGLAMQLGGLAWMWRIYRADPEPDQRIWRYRAR